MAQLAKFRIVTRGTQEARVRPPSDTCEKQGQNDPPQQIRFINMTADFAWAKLPGGVFLDNANQVIAQPFVLQLDPKGQNGAKKTLNVSNQANGLFSFKVFCDETFSFAEGNSDPEFIIEN